MLVRKQFFNENSKWLIFSIEVLRDDLARAQAALTALSVRAEETEAASPLAGIRCAGGSRDLG